MKLTKNVFVRYEHHFEILKSNYGMPNAINEISFLK